MNDAITNECYNEQFLSIKSGCYNEHRCYSERGGTLFIKQSSILFYAFHVRSIVYAIY